MKICKDGRVWGQNNKEAGSHLGTLNKSPTKYSYKRKFTDEELTQYRKNIGERLFGGRFKKGHKNSEKIRRKISIGHMGELNSQYGKKAEDSPAWKGGRPKCVDCGKQLFTYSAKRCKECRNKFYVGENVHWGWRGGISKTPYPFNFNDELKELIKRRDNYECQLCNSGVHLMVHHIDYNKENIDPKNLTTLCCSCNSSVNFHREDWVVYFKGVPCSV